MIKELDIKEAQLGTPMQLNTLTLEKNSVLVARIPQNGGYDCEMMQALYKALKDRFPMHQILVCYDDVEFMAIHDKGYMPERITCNDENPYGY